MSTGLKKVWNEGDRWNEVAYVLYTDSREWRYLLALNPSYDIRSVPAAGVEIPVSGDLGDGKFRPASGQRPGTLKQVDLALDLRGSTSNRSSTAPEGIYPWSSFDLYVNRAGEYTSYALLAPETCNGPTLDSLKAATTPIGTFQQRFETTTQNSLSQPTTTNQSY